MQRLSQHRHAVGVFGVFALSVTALPTFIDVAIHDDWVYARVARELAENGKLEIPEASAVYAIFDGVWGALFSLPAGFSLGALRFASVVLLGLGGWAFYGLARELGARPERAALATALYLFNPLTFVLAFTYMTDTHVMALLTIATYFYVRAWRRDRIVDAFLASAVVTLALLSRNAGVAAAVGAGAYALAHRQWRHATAAAALPLVVALGRRAWFSAPRQMKGLETLVSTEARDLGTTWEVALVVVFIALVYIGLAGFPLLVATRFRLPGRRRIWFGLAAVVLVLCNGLVGRFAPPERMPYVGDWLADEGLGPLAMLGSRSSMPGWIWTTATVIAIVGAVAAAWVSLTARPGVVRWIGVLLVVSVLPAGFIFMPPLDRYFVVLFPVALALLAAAPEAGRTAVLGWTAAGVMALSAFVGTHDYLTAHKMTWALAESATRTGVALTQLDAGAGWVGWHFATESGAPVATPNPPWWIGWGPEVDSTYVISVDMPPPGYTAVEAVDSGTWILGPEALVLSRRNG